MFSFLRRITPLQSVQSSKPSVVDKESALPGVPPANRLRFMTYAYEESFSVATAL